MRKQADSPSMRRLWYWMPTAIFFTGMFSMALLLWANRISERQYANALVNNAVMDMEIHAVTAHLLLEEAIIAGARGDDALAEMDEAIKLANTLFAGGNSEHGWIPAPQKDPELLDRVEAARSKIMKARALALARLRNSQRSGVGSVLDRQFDGLYDDFFEKAKGLDDFIGKRNEQSRIASGRLFLGILFAWSFIVIAATAGSWSRERRRERAEKALLQANERLSTQTEELTEHRQHLQELVGTRTEELSAANRLLQAEVAERRRMEEEIRTLYDGLEVEIEQRTRQLFDAQEELLRREKLSLLGIVAGNVGNELRNPLGVMSNAVYFLSSQLTDADPPIREYLEIISSEIEGSQRVLSDFIDFFRTIPPWVREVSVPGLINQSLAVCAVPENITVGVELPETLPLVKVDPSQMRQVFGNLITNAVQAMPNGGALRIAARRWARFGVQGAEEAPTPEPRTPDPEENFVEISVADSGAGIPLENLEKIFQPLFTTKSRGIGLGLSICKNFVEANGGRMVVSSAPGEGSTFTVTLPAEL